MVSRLNLASSPSQPETALTQEEVEENNQVDCVYFLRSLQQIESPEEAFSDSQELHSQSLPPSGLSHQPEFPQRNRVGGAAGFPREPPGVSSERSDWNTVFLGKNCLAREWRRMKEVGTLAEN